MFVCICVSQCSASCGVGYQQRFVSCSLLPSSLHSQRFHTQPSSAGKICPEPHPPATQPCFLRECPHTSYWKVGPWTKVKHRALSSQRKSVPLVSNYPKMLSLFFLFLGPSVHWPVGQEWWSVGWSVWPPRGKCLNTAVHQTDRNHKLRVKRDNVRFSLSIRNKVLNFCSSSRVTRVWLRLSLLNFLLRWMTMFCKVCSYVTDKRQTEQWSVKSPKLVMVFNTLTCF